LQGTGAAPSELNPVLSLILGFVLMFLIYEYSLR